MISWLSKVFGGNDEPEKADKKSKEIHDEIWRKGFAEGKEATGRTNYDTGYNKGYAAGLADGKASIKPSIRVEKEVVDFHPGLTELCNQLKRLRPADQHLVDLVRAVGAIHLPGIDVSKAERVMSQITNAVKKITKRTEEYKELDDLVNKLALGERRASAVVVKIAAKGSLKAETVEIPCTPEEAINLCRKEMLRLHGEITKAQEEAHAAISAIAVGAPPLTPPSASSQTTGETAHRRIRRSDEPTSGTTTNTPGGPATRTS